MDNKNGCPKCGNRMGFAFGRCSGCGFNYLSEQFETIKIDTKLLKSIIPEDLYWQIIFDYEDRVERRKR